MSEGEASSGPTPVRRREQEECTVAKAGGTDATPGNAVVGRLMVGQLSPLLTIPMDVFLEVVVYLKPLDLLHLARVSSTFRKMLLSRTSRKLWVAARKNMVPQIPDGPDDLNEPLYARLLFERDCTRCGATNAAKVDYANAHRYCERCWNQSVQSGGQLVYDLGLYNDSTFKSVIFDLLPAAPGSSSGGIPYMAGLGFYTDPHVAHVGPEAGKNTEHTMFHRDDFAALAEEYRQMCMGEATMSMEQFVAKHKTRTQGRLSFHTEIVTVEFYRRQARVVFEHQPTARKLAIEEKLRELDYHLEDYPTMTPEFHALLDEQTTLTPHIWDNIKPKLLKLLEVERIRRVDDAFRINWFMRMHQLQSLYKSFVQDTKECHSEDVWERTMPTFHFALKLPSMRALLTSAHSSEHITQRDFAAMKPALVGDVRAALLKVQHHCASVLRDYAARRAQASFSTSTHNNKGKGKAHDLSEEVVKPEAIDEVSEAIDVDDVFAHDYAAADRALLERPTSLFRCDHPRCPGQRNNMLGSSNRDGTMTFLGVLEHDATYHSSSSWDEIPVRPATEEFCALIPRLFDALGMPHSTTLSALHERLSNEVPVRCSCGVSFHMPPTVNPYHTGEDVTLRILLQHVSPPPRHRIRSSNGLRETHNITLQPRLNAPTHDPGFPPGYTPIYKSLHPLAIMELAQFASTMANAQHGPQALIVPLGAFQQAQAPYAFGAPGEPVGLTHPFVQRQMHALAALLNEPEALLDGIRGMLPGKRRRAILDPTTV